MHKIVLGIILAILQNLAMASETCFESAGRTYNIDADLIRSIAWQESNFQVHAKNINSDGSSDTGVMQINQIHYARLQKMGISEAQLGANGCLNVFVGTYILAEIFKQYGISWNAIGIYNAGASTKKSTTAQHRAQYASQINARLRAVRSARYPGIEQPKGWLPLSNYNQTRKF
jgi:soluble lytic murein transglycosylase-like protein